jgi:hypothetical protein
MELQRSSALSLWNDPQFRTEMLKSYPSQQAYTNAVEANSPRMLSWHYLIGPGGAAVRQILFWLLLPLLQLTVLMLFQASMRNARVKTIHVWRCLVYSWDFALIVGAILVLAAIAEVAGQSLFAEHWQVLGLLHQQRGLLPLAAFLQCAMLVLLLSCSIKLAAAYRLYLRFDHPELTVASVLLILLLLIAVLASSGVI